MDLRAEEHVVLDRKRQGVRPLEDHPDALAQLHQLRGRVGRGDIASSCILMYHGPLSETAGARLAATIEHAKPSGVGELKAEEDMMDGTTAAVGRLVGENEQGQVAIITGGTLVVGNVGDSELVLCRAGEAVPLCEVAPPSQPAAPTGEGFKTPTVGAI